MKGSDISSRQYAEVASSLDCPPELLCTEDDILDLLRSLDVTKANGPDGISAVMLKATAPNIAKGVMILFIKSIQHEDVPKKWKTSSVIPIPKDNDTCQPSNYRPISLLSVLSISCWKGICTNTS